MKINQEIRNAQKEAAHLYREAAEALAKANDAVMAEENAMIQRMFNQVFYSNEALSAKEIAAKLGGDMSWQEVSGQMVVANHPVHWPKHEPTREVRRRRAIKRDVRRKTRKFAEIDEHGNIVPGGDTVCKHTVNVVYSKN